MPEVQKYFTELKQSFFALIMAQKEVEYLMKNIWMFMQIRLTFC